MYSLRLTDKELPVEFENGGNDLKTIGLKRPESHAFLTLLLEIAFTLVFWLMIHEFIRKKLDKHRPSVRVNTTIIFGQIFGYFLFHMVT